ncbi:GNAT family N-acetyltransferase [Roseitranquillus sediminis]|uniref:GNAT family N-acetyltransferase n=1 Tax=Roseitranquillus sediminis TaxID=2809051 RepID=UPI0029C9E7AF|nr:GNAT family N-acetyltransferase [Roseitranquillus sediminis]
MASPHVFLIGGATAFALGRTAADEAELLTLVTAPEYRRQGLARRCLAAFEAEAAQRGATVSLLEVAADNHAACDLYASAGYNEAGRRRGYYDSSTDALILRKKIASS